MFDGVNDQAEEAAFVHGVNLVNDDRSVLIRSRLIAVVNNNVPRTNSFKASRKCKTTVIKLSDFLCN